MVRQILTIFLCIATFTASAQELEPRAYANLPKGLNAIAVVYALSRGNVVTDPALPIADFKITSHTVGLGYVHTFGLMKKLARVQFTLPACFLSGKLVLNGKDTSGARGGFGDARIKFGINLIGSPAMDRRSFKTFKQKTIVGISVVVNVPTGLYYPDKRINIGSNRWAIKPELGISQQFNRLYLEGYSGVWLYSENHEYLGNKTQKQEAVFSFQAHAIYYFKNQMWVGVDGNWFNGGKTLVDDVPLGDLKDNWRIGATWSVPLSPQHSLKFQFHIGAFTSSGYDYNVWSVAYQFVF